MSTLLEIAIEMGGTAECPECDGTGKVAEVEGHRWMVDEAGQPVMVTCWLCHGTGRVEQDPLDDREPAS